MKILFVGESAMVCTTEFKGYDSFSATRYGEAFSVMENTIRELGHEVTHIPCHLVAREFPRTLEGLRDYDLILFSDVGSNTFLLLPDMLATGQPVPNLLKLVCQYVEQGGGFGMIGGYMTFQGMEGRGKYKDSVLEKILPVELYYGDDRQETPEGTFLTCVPDSHPILQGLPAQMPYILGYNKLRARRESTVLIEHEGDAILSVWQYGQGRTMAYATDCAPHWAPREMTQWEYYPRLWDNIIRYLAGSTSAC